MSVRLLGTFEVRVDGRTVSAETWRHRRAAELVKLLALSPRTRLHREVVIDTLWPDLPLTSGAANLRKAAHYARRALGRGDAVTLRGEHVVLGGGDEVDVDVLQFEREAQGAIAAGDPEACAAIAHQYAELLPDDRYVEWADERRTRLRDVYLQLLRRAGLWEDLVDVEPTDEAGVRMLMRLNAEAGNRSAALAQYHRLRRALAQLELEPEGETANLYREIAHAPLERSPVQYTQSNGVNIAYQVVEGGPAELLLVPGWVSHLALDWEEPYWVRWCERMTAFARLVRFDKRGTGLSDRPSGAQPLDERMHDALAVLDAAGVGQTHVLAWSEGGPLAILLASTHPERVRSLILYGTQACFSRLPDYPWGATAEERELLSDEVEHGWPLFGLEDFVAPGADEGFAERHAAYLRAGASPRTAADLNRMNLAIDVRHLLAAIRVPALVLSRRGDVIGPPAPAKYMAERIPDARFVELEGDDHVPWIGQIEALCSQIERFVLSVDARVPAGNVSGTVLL